MTDVSNLDNLAAAIASSSAKIRNYAVAQAAASQSQETDIQSRAKQSELDALKARVTALESAAPPPTMDVFAPKTKAGMNYTDPISGCCSGGITAAIPAPCNQHWAWLTSCYQTHTRAMLQRDLDFIVQNKLGKFQRVWVSLDQLFSSFNATTGFGGWNNAYLANLDDALARFDAAGIQVDLVLLTGGQVNGFHYEALDGNHPTMRANYLRAITEFMAHIAGNAVSSRTVLVSDLMNEVFFQCEQQLKNTNGCGTNNTCLDENVIAPWIEDMYDAAKAGAPNKLYTASDTGRLRPATAYWINLFGPIDVYDIHAYSTNAAAEVWEGALGLPKPWFCGEAGCNPGNTACTYNGNNAQTVQIDGWWLDNLPSYGCKSVLIEDRGTAMTPNATPSMTQVGTLIKNKNP